MTGVSPGDECHIIQDAESHATNNELSVHKPVKEGFIMSTVPYGIRSNRLEVMGTWSEMVRLEYLKIKSLIVQFSSFIYSNRRPINYHSDGLYPRWKTDCEVVIGKSQKNERSVTNKML